MYSQVTNTKFASNLQLKDIRWGVVIDHLMTRFNLSYIEASAAVDSFYRRANTFFPVSWFDKPKLKIIDNEIVLTICEVCSLDSFTLIKSYNLIAGLLPVAYTHKLSFNPSRMFDARGYCLANINIVILGKAKTITNKYSAFILKLLIIASAIITYMIFVQALLYGMAVFALLLQHPEPVAEAATRHASLAFGIIFFLIGIMGTCGGVVRFIYKKLVKKALP